MLISKRVCDRCGKPVEYPNHVKITAIECDDENHYDLCPECFDYIRRLIINDNKEYETIIKTTKIENDKGIGTES